MKAREAMSLKVGDRVCWMLDDGATGRVTAASSQFFRAVSIYWYDTHDTDTLHVDNCKHIERE